MIPEHIPTILNLKSDFPILNQHHQTGNLLTYLDSAASSQMPNIVIEAMSDYHRRYHANVHRGIHQLSELATEAYELARKKVKGFINAKSKREVIFTKGTTEGINLVVHAWGRANLGQGDVVLVSQMEHHSNIVPYQILAQEKGFTIRFIPITPMGEIDLLAYQQLLADNPVKLVAVTHCSNVLGTINPIAEMARLAHKYGAIIVVDGAQSTPHMSVDVQALDVDFFAFSGHKMCAPTGVGVLYGKQALLEAMPSFLGGGSMINEVTWDGFTPAELPAKFEAGTPNIAQAIGLGYAIDYLQAIGMDNIHQHVQTITTYALEGLRQIPSIRIYGDSPSRGGLIAFTLSNIHAHDLSQALDFEGIAVRSGHHCAQPLHRLLGVNATTRASFYLYTTKADIDRLVVALGKVVQFFKG
ncbi:MAG: cysteine desulfurase [Phototrophicales bacterium]|nr:MAG: cysteine desulfurase [Phototrophicales bacterium]